MVIPILAKSGWDSTALRRPWPTRIRLRIDKIQGRPDAADADKPPLTPLCILVAQTSSFPVVCQSASQRLSDHSLSATPHHPTVETFRFNHLLTTRFSGSAGYVRVAAIFRHAFGRAVLLVPCCWTGLLRGCKVEGAPKGERKRVLGKIQEQKRTPLLPATTAAFHCPIQTKTTANTHYNTHCPNIAVSVLHKTRKQVCWRSRVLRDSPSHFTLTLRTANRRIWPIRSHPLAIFVFYPSPVSRSQPRPFTRPLKPPMLHHREPYVAPLTTTCVTTSRPRLAPRTKPARPAESRRPPATQCRP